MTITIVKKTLRIYLVTIFFASALVIGLTRFVIAAEKKGARVTQVIRDVRLLASHAAPRPAMLNDNVSEGTAVRTGNDSRVELTFSDQTLARLGANTIFSIGAENEAYDLGSGVVLMHVPKNSGPARINTSVATAAVTGFTAIYEFHTQSWNKFLILEGHGAISLKHYPGQTRQMHAGQIITFRPDATTLPEPQDFDICKLTEKSLLITQFPRLPSWNLILEECQKQQTSLPSSNFIDPTSQDTIDQNINARPSPPPPQGSPSGF